MRVIVLLACAIGVCSQVQPSMAVRGGAKKGSAKKGSAKKGSAKKGSAKKGSAKKGSSKKGSSKKGSYKKGKKGKKDKKYPAEKPPSKYPETGSKYPETESKYPETVSVDCIGSWGSWGSCSAECGGKQASTYKVKAKELYGGAPCAASNREKRMQDCGYPCPEPEPEPEPVCKEEYGSKRKGYISAEFNIDKPTSHSSYQGGNKKGVKKCISKCCDTYGCVAISLGKGKCYLKNNAKGMMLETDSYSSYETYNIGKY